MLWFLGVHISILGDSSKGSGCQTIYKHICRPNTVTFKKYIIIFVLQAYFLYVYLAPVYLFCFICFEVTADTKKIPRTGDSESLDRCR